jgi:hypothetical protein
MDSKSLDTLGFYGGMSGFGAKLGWGLGSKKWPIWLAQGSGTHPCLEGSLVQFPDKVKNSGGALCSHRKPGVQGCLGLRIDLAEEKAHAEMRMVVNDGRRSFELVSLGEDFYVYSGAVGKRIDNVDIAAMKADVADARW